MNLLEPGRWLFSIKTFCAAILALAVAFWLDLPKPYWALASVYIASQPLAGATLSKAWYRAVGTLVGAAAAVALTPNLVNTPELLASAISLWVGFCLYLSLLDRSPRSYAFLLAGYTAAIVAFPAVDAPQSIFDLALARSEEIIIGILSAGVVSTVVFPRSVGPVVAERLAAWLSRATASSLDALKGATPADDERRWLMLAAETAEFENVAAHLDYEAGSSSGAASHVQNAVPRMLMLLPVLSSISDRLAVLAKIGGAAERTNALIAQTAAWIESPDEGPGNRLQALRAMLEAQEERALVDLSWRDLIEAGLMQRLRDLVDLHADYATLLHALSSGSRDDALSLAFPIERHVEPVRHKDLAAALIPAFTASCALAACCLFWIASAWPDGATAAAMTAVTAGLFGAQDDPTPSVIGFVKWTFAATFIAGVYTFLILPRVHGFETLALVLTPTFLVFGWLTASPATAGAGLPLSLFTSLTMALQELYSADAEAFINSSLATIAGMGFTGLATALIRPAGAAWRAARYVSANRRALAEAADVHTQNDQARVLGLMFDRLALLAPIAHALDHSMAGALRELRAGFNILETHDARAQLGPKARRSVDALLKRLARHYRWEPRKPRPALARAAARALRYAHRERDRRTLLSLSGMWGALFPDSPPPELPLFTETPQ